MPAFITDTSFDSRLRSAISAAWAVFARKVGSNLFEFHLEVTPGGFGLHEKHHTAREGRMLAPTDN